VSSHSIHNPHRYNHISNHTVTFESGQCRPHASDFLTFENVTLPNHWTAELLLELVNGDARVKRLVVLLNAHNSTCRVPYVTEYERRDVYFEDLGERREEGAEEKNKKKKEKEKET
jgi:hypothetical protein